MSGEFRVGDWLIEPDLNRARNGETVVQIEPKVLEVLAFLADHPGEVLSRDRIIRTVWAGTFVSEGILSYYISELRKALNDDARDPRIIQTISRKGYRLVSPVVRLSPNHKRRPSIAILPFCDMSAEKDQEYFCDGIAEEIINNLTRMKGLSVASRTSSFAFKGKCEDVRTMGQKLGVSTVLEGSIRKAGAQLRITVQLINVEDGYQLWSERYDRQLRDVFAIQDEISIRIAETLKVTLSPEESGSFGKTPTTDLQAYDYYLRGKQFYYQYQRKSIEFALRMFSHAIELDSRYARAYAGLSDCCAFLYLYAGSQETHRSQADKASSIAIDLDPESAEAHASRGVALALLGNYPAAEAALDTAIRLGPRLFEGYFFYARTAFVQGKFERAIELYEKASEVQPLDYQSPLLVAQILADLGRAKDAENARRKGISLAEARLRLNPDDARALYMGANGLVALGDRDRGLEWARQARAQDPTDPMLLYNVACIMALAGKPDEALDCLEMSIKNGLTERRWLERDSNLDSLRALPRYETLLAGLQPKSAAAAS